MLAPQNHPELTGVKLEVAQLLARNGIKFEAVYTGTARPWEPKYEADAWLIVFASDKVQERFNYYSGTGGRKQPGELRGLKRNVNKFHFSYTEPRPVAPCAADVLSCLLSDAEALHMSFTDWCDNYGYNSDSIKALSTYQACESIGKRLRGFLSREVRDTLQQLLQDF